MGSTKIATKVIKDNYNLRGIDLVAESYCT